MNLLKRIMAVMLLAAWLGGCSDEPRQQINTDPVAFDSMDECHVCGMLIIDWPGAKGQSINRQNGEIHKFCSTIDLFSWWLQPENLTVQAQVYVHDMAKTGWNKPADEYLMDGRDAWYVLGSGLQGAMGPTLASFSTEAAAQELVEQRGGRILRFEQIDFAVLQEIASLSLEQATSYAEEMQRLHHDEDAAEGRTEGDDPAADAGWSWRRSGRN